MALVTFPSGTNQQIFVSFMEDNYNQTDYEDRGENGVHLRSYVLNDSQSSVDFVFSLGGAIEDCVGH